MCAPLSPGVVQIWKKTVLVLTLFVVFLCASIGYYGRSRQRVSVIALLEETKNEWIKHFSTMVLIGALAYAKGSLTIGGSALATAMGTLLLQHYRPLLVANLAFLVLGTLATRLKKKTRDKASHVKGRNAAQVYCNGFIGIWSAAVYIIWSMTVSQEGPGSYNVPIKSSSARGYDSPEILKLTLTTSLVSVCAAAGDTLSGDIAMAFVKKPPFFIIPDVVKKPPFLKFVNVPKKTNGGVTCEGCVIAILGGAAVAITFSLWTLNLRMILHNAKLGAFSGLVGTIIDSVLGATMQPTFVKKTDQSGTLPVVLSEQDAEVWLAEQSRIPDTIRLYSGRFLLDNHSVNVCSQVLTTALVVFYLNCRVEIG